MRSMSESSRTGTRRKYSTRSKGHFEESIKKIVQSLGNKEVQAEICDHYCKYTNGYKDADDETFAERVNQYCVDCPLNKL